MPLILQGSPCADTCSQFGNGSAGMIGMRLGTSKCKVIIRRLGQASQVDVPSVMLTWNLSQVNFFFRGTKEQESIMAQSSKMYVKN